MPLVTHKTTFSVHLLIILFILFSFSCEKGDLGPQGPAGSKSLLDIQPLAAGAACANGGVVILSGIDKNNNGKLDSTEADQTQNVCNGPNGASGLKSLLDIQPLAAGTACANGGVVILSGIDENNNGKLDSTEVDQTQNICNGPAGLKSLLDVQPLPVGSVCTNGGVVIRSGIDRNNDGKLDNDEVDQIQNVCSGPDGINSGEQDKQIVLHLGGSKSISQTPNLGLDPIIKFKKSNFTGVDSIVFIAVPYVSDPSFEAVVDLYNVTDEAGITGSEIISNQLLNVNGFLQTGNLYNQIPDKEITLVTRTRSTKEGAYAGCYYAYLVLYRK